MMWPAPASFGTSQLRSLKFRTPHRFPARHHQNFLLCSLLRKMFFRVLRADAALRDQHRRFSLPHSWGRVRPLAPRTNRSASTHKQSVDSLTTARGRLARRVRREGPVDLPALERRLLRLETLASRLKLIKSARLGEPINDKVSMLDRSGARIQVGQQSHPSRHLSRMSFGDRLSSILGLLRARAAHTSPSVAAAQSPAAARIYCQSMMRLKVRRMRAVR